MRKLLVVVDMQKDFMFGGKLGMPFDTKDFENRVAEFVNNFNGPVLIIRDTHFKNDIEFTQFPKHCVELTDGWKIIDGIKRNDAIIANKYSFTSRWITDQLLIYAHEEIHFCGVCTHICVHDIIAEFVNAAKNEIKMIPNIIVDRLLVSDFDKLKEIQALERLAELYNVKVK